MDSPDGAESPHPEKPCVYAVGTRERFEEMRRRAERGEALTHPEDLNEALPGFLAGRRPN